MNIQEAKVLITGGTSGIGYETARILKENGAEVLITARTKSKIEKAVKELNVMGYQADVSQENEVKSLFEYAKKEMGEINVVINNAGKGKFSSLVDTTLESFQKQWEVNTKGVFLVGREAARLFIDNQYGNIINIGSTAAIRGFAGGTSYVSSKFGVSGLTESWRAELRPHNIRVFQVNPSEVITDFIENAGMERKNTEFKLKPADIGQVILSLLSMNDVGFIPGVEIWATNPNRKS